MDVYRLSASVKTPFSKGGLPFVILLITSQFSMKVITFAMSHNLILFSKHCFLLGDVAGIYSLVSFFCTFCTLTQSRINRSIDEIPVRVDE